MAKYNPEPYTPDGGVHVLGLPVLVAMMLVASIAVGWLASVVSQWMWIILISPLLISLAVILIGWYAVGVAKLRHSVIAGWLGFAAGCVIMLTMHYVDYQRFKSERDDRLQAQPEQPPEAKPEAQAEFEKLQALRNVTNFVGFMNWQAEQGVTLLKGSINIGYVGSWICWSIEFLLVALLTSVGLVTRACEPFCGSCNQWKVEHTLGGLSSDPEVVEFVEEGDLDRLYNYQPHPTKGRYQLKACVCPTCGEDGSISVKVCAVTTKKNGKTAAQEMVHLTYPGAALSDLEALFNRAKKAKGKRDEQDD